MALNVPVLVGVVPLLKVQSYVVKEGYKSASIAASPLMQMVAPTTKTISIEAFLVDAERALRPALEILALTSRALASVTAPLMSATGIPVISKNFIHLDMQITSLSFTQDNQNRETLKVSIELTNVPRPKLGGLLALADVALGAGSAFI
ncbi:MAG: hypothetical protein P4M09_03025 [Devosia sp.]|nr:hypothetical protein [Devosia sp.]